MLGNVLKCLTVPSSSNCVTAPIFTMKAVYLDDIINVNFAESNSMGDTHNHVEIFSPDEYLFN